MRVAREVPTEFAEKLRGVFGPLVRLAYFPDDERFWLLTLNKRTRLWDKLRSWENDDGKRLPFNDGGLHYARARLVHSSESTRDDAEVDRAVRDAKQKEEEDVEDEIHYRAQNNERLMYRDDDLFKDKKKPKAKPIISLPPEEKGE